MAAEAKIKISVDNKGVKGAFEEINRVAQTSEKTLTSITKTSGIAFTGLSVSILATTNAFAEFEKGLVGVQKTSNLSTEATQKLGKEILDLSTKIPVSSSKLLRFGEIAGQLGVRGSKDILTFADTIAKLESATDLVGEQGATDLAQILNVTNEASSEIATLGAVIVELGNNFETSESRIVRATNEIARTTSAFKLSSAEATALGTTLSSLGIRAEGGGSAIGRTFRSIEETIRNGGQPLRDLEKLLGMTGDQIRIQFGQNAIGVFQKFLEGLKGVPSAAAELEKFGLRGDEINKVLPVLALRSDKFAKALELANGQVKNATALNEEADRAFKTLSAEFEKTKNTLSQVSVEIGSEFAPALKGILISVRDMIKSVRELNPDIISAIANFLKWGAIISGAVTSIGAFLLGAIKISAVIGTLSAVFVPATVAASAFWVAVTGPIGIAIAGVAALTAGFFALKSTFDDTSKSTKEVANEIDALKKKQDDLKKRSDNVNEGDRLANESRIAGIQNEIDELDKLLKKKEEILKKDQQAQEGFGVLQKPDDLGAIQQDIEVNTKEGTGSVILDQMQVQADAEKDLLVQAEAEKTAIAEQSQLERQNKLAQAKQEALNLAHQQELERIQLEDEEIQTLKDELDLVTTEKEAEANAKKIESENERRSFELNALREEKKNKQKLEDDEKKKRLIDEVKYGTTMAKIKSTLRSEELKGVSDFSNELVGLTQSSNNTLKTIGKASAITQILINSAKSASNVFESATRFLPFPAGPIAGTAGAVAALAFGAERANQVRSARTGGVVPGTGQGDKTNMMLEPGEIVIPKPLAPTFRDQFALNRDEESPVKNGSTNNFINPIMTEDFVRSQVMPIISDDIQNNNGDLGL